MTPSDISVLIIIVNFRTPELAVNAVESLRDEVSERKDSFVVLVDNGSADGSAEWMAAELQIRGLGEICALLPLSENGGFAAGNNRALEWYRAAYDGNLPEFVWLLNPDTVAQPGAIGGLVDFMRRTPAAGIIGSRCLAEHGEARASAFRFHSPLTEIVSAARFGPLTRLLGNREVALPVVEEPSRADWVSGSSFMIRRAVIDSIGPMDEGFFLYFEEEDYCSRAAEAGFETWVVPTSVITHIGGQSTKLTGAGKVRKPLPTYWFAARARFLARKYGILGAHLANVGFLIGFPVGWILGRRKDDPPRFLRDFIRHYYGFGGLMYKPGELTS